MTQTIVQETSGRDYLPLKRVAYGRADTPKQDNEYVIDGEYVTGGLANSPVGTIADWKQFAKQNGFSGLRVFNEDGSVDFHLFEGC